MPITTKERNNATSDERFCFFFNLSGSLVLLVIIVELVVVFYILEKPRIFIRNRPTMRITATIRTTRRDLCLCFLSIASFCIEFRFTSAFLPNHPLFAVANTLSKRAFSSQVYNNRRHEDDDDEDNEDDMIDVDSLGNWRDFRRSLGQSFSSSSSVPEIRPATSVSTENEAVLATQNEELALEYRNGVWAHETSVVRFV